MSIYSTGIMLEKMEAKQGCCNSTSSTTPIKVYLYNTPFLTVTVIWLHNRCCGSESVLVCTVCMCVRASFLCLSITWYETIPIVCYMLALALALLVNYSSTCLFYSSTCMYVFVHLQKAILYLMKSWVLSIALIVTLKMFVSL